MEAMIYRGFCGFQVTNKQMPLGRKWNRAINTFAAVRSVQAGATVL